MLCFQYGDIAVLVVSSSKKGSALVEYKNPDAAVIVLELVASQIQSRIKLILIYFPGNGNADRIGIFKESAEASRLVGIRETAEDIDDHFNQ